MRALTSLALFAAPLLAQRPGVHASARFGLAVPSEDYDASCGDLSLALSVDVHGKGRLFPQLSLDRFTGSGGGGDDLCIPVPPTVGTAVGGLRLDGATRVGLGAGGRVGRGIVQLEAAALGGVVIGRSGFGGVGSHDQRALLPHVGTQAAVVLVRHLVVSGSVHWTRLSMAITPVGGGSATTRRWWSPMSTMQVGARVGLGR